MRHTFAHNWLAALDDVASLQIVLGHKHLSSTQVYTPMLKVLHDGT